LAKIAVELEHALVRRRQNGTPGCTTPRVIARGEGWTVADVVCTCGPQDHPFEERHPRYTIAIVLAGSFQYRSTVDRGLMTPGSLLLGNHGQSFECGHQHGEGDRCVSFWYEPEYFERLVADAGAGRRQVGFSVPRLPPSPRLSPLVARAGAGVLGAAGVTWEELAVSRGARTFRLAAGDSSSETSSPPNAEGRVTRAVRTIDQHPNSALSLGRLARDAGLSPYHFLRTFARLTGITPHQYVLRARLREAATRLLTGPENVLDVALDCGFADVSNFNRAFRMEFGVSPRAFRRTSRWLGHQATPALPNERR
jgi:AraC family transcriptional regulator